MHSRIIKNLEDIKRKFNELVDLNKKAEITSENINE
jgi:hypothetical protein